MSKIEGNLFFKYTFQVRETLSPMFALRQKYLEYFLRWYHFIQAKASPSRITTRKIPPKKAPTESDELELETGHGFGVVGSVVEVVEVVGLGGISVELFVVVMGSAVDVVASVVAFFAGVFGASAVAFVVAVVVASIVAFAVGVVGAFAFPLLVVVSAAAAKAQKKKATRRILLTGI